MINVNSKSITKSKIFKHQNLNPQAEGEDFSINIQIKNI